MKLIELIKNLHEILKWDHAASISVMLCRTGEEQTIPEVRLAPTGKTLSELCSLEMNQYYNWVFCSSGLMFV